jgi:hypothetical protein
MAQIFISYNHRSLDAVKTLAKDLEAAGNYVWFDQALTGGTPEEGEEDTAKPPCF